MRTGIWVFLGVVLVLLPCAAGGQMIQETLRQGKDMLFDWEYRQAVQAFTVAISIAEATRDSTPEDVAILNEMEDEIDANSQSSDWEETPHINNPHQQLSELHYFRGQCFYQLKKYTLADADFTAAIQYGYAIEDGAVYGLRGLCHYHQRNYQLAIDDFEKEVNLPHWRCGAFYPFNETYYFLRLCYCKLGEKETGCQLLQQAAAEEYTEAQSALCKYCR